MNDVYVIKKNYKLGKITKKKKKIKINAQKLGKNS